MTVDIEPIGKTVKLTAVHYDFETGNTVLESVGGSWPRVLSELKTVLETGETLLV